MYEEMMTNDDNVESGLLTSSLLKIHSLYKLSYHIGATKGSQEKHAKFPIDVDPIGPYKHHLVVRVDTGADVNCMNEKTFKKLFPKVKLSVCPHKIQNFGNSVADISVQVTSSVTSCTCSAVDGLNCVEFLHL